MMLFQHAGSQGGRESYVYTIPPLRLHNVCPFIMCSVADFIRPDKSKTRDVTRGEVCLDLPLPKK